MAVISTPDGFMSIRDSDIKPTDVVVSRGSGGGGGGMSTPETPTPSAEQLFGTSAQREAQIQAFRRGGQAEFERIRQSAIQQRRAQQQITQQQLQQQQLVQAYAGQRRTATDFIVPETTTKVDVKVHPPGTIYKVQTDTFKVPGKKKYIPITETYTVGKDYTSREATTEERELLRESEQARITKELTEKGTPSRVGFEISELWGDYKDFASEELMSRESLQNVFGTSKVGEFTGAVIYGTVGTKGDLLRTGAIYGATAGLGYLIGATTTGATAGATALWGAKAGGYAGTTIKLGTYGAGAYLGGKYVLETGQRIYEAPTAWEKGEIFGRSGADIFASIYGFRAGSKLWDVTYGKIRTKGRTEIPPEQIIMEGALEGETYPSKPINQHWNEFQENSQRLTIKLEGYTGEGKFISPAEVQQLPVNVPPKLYHTAGTQFWDSKLNVVKTGDSEFAGLFGGSGVSPTFARVTGSSSKTKLFPSWVDLTSINKPGTATIIPKKFVKGTFGKPGEAFVPGAAGFPKPEIQAIYAVGSEGELISSRFFYKWEGVNIPLDVYKDITGATVGTTGGQPISTILKSYSSYTPPPVIDITAGLVSAYKPSTTTTTPSVSSLTPSYSSVTSSMPSTSSIVSSSKPVSSSRPSSRSYSSAMSSIVPSSYKPSSYKPSSKITSDSSVSKLYSSIYSSSVRKPYRYSYGYYGYYKKPQVKFKPMKLPKQTFGKFPVYGRRFGKFRIVGMGRTEKEAFALGKKFARETLGVTFKISGVSGRKLPGYKTKLTKKGVLYIEPRGRRLKKRGTEVKEIQLYQRAKAKSKSKKLKGGRKKK